MDLSSYLRDLMVLRSQLQLQIQMHDSHAWLQYYQPAISDKPFWQPWIAEDAASAAKSQKQLPTTKWKRDRRTRPEYQQRKVDAKVPPCDISTDTSSSSTSTSPTLTTKKVNGLLLGDGPLDMSTRQRGLPPSYSQAISDPSFRSVYTRPRTHSVKGREDLPTGISMCDPIIDEHFRRSLGKDYNTVFNNNNAKESAKVVEKPTVVVAAVVPPPPPPVTSVVEMMDTTGLSVDEHFAKALGETWHLLNNAADGSRTAKKNATSKSSSKTSNNNGNVTNSVAEPVST